MTPCIAIENGTSARRNPRSVIANPWPALHYCMETQLWFSFACLAMAVCLYVICDGLKPRKPFRLADYIRRRD